MEIFKLMRFLIKLATISLLIGWPAVSMSNDISVYLLPKHKTYLGFNEHNYRYVELLDNDGNLYITFWEVKEVSLSDFDQTVFQCRKAIKENMLFGKLRNMLNVDMDEIKPSLFKVFNLCIRNKGYMHKSSDAFYPNSYKLSLYRGHSTTGKYMPVGASYTIERKKSDYTTVFQDARLCVSKENEKNKSYEDNSSHFLHVDIGPYARAIELCLAEKNYIVRAVKSSSTDEALEVKNDKDKRVGEETVFPGA